MGKFRKFINVFIIITLVTVPLSVQANYTCANSVHSDHAHSDHDDDCIHCDDDHNSNEYVLSFNFSGAPHSCCHTEINLYSEIFDALLFEVSAGFDPPPSVYAIIDGEIKFLTSHHLLLLKSYSIQQASNTGVATYLATQRIRI